MKYILSLLLGLILGAITAIAMIVFNPLTLSQSQPLSNADMAFDYSMEASWVSTHSNRLNIPVVPKGSPLLFENGIRGSLLSSMPLNGETGRAPAAGTRISVPSSESGFLRSGLLVDDYWLISVPGAGTVFMHAVNNQWPLVRDTVVWVDLLKRKWNASGQYDPTRGPAAAGAQVVGMTGTFKDLRGVGQEHVSLDSYSGNLGALHGRLTIRSSAKRN
jgi:hypothetical protein